jgi:manganese efflux pump family protein
MTDYGSRCFSSLALRSMSPITLTVLAFSMSMDAFVASLSRGAALRTPRLIEAAKTGLVFGVIEAITPTIGWAAGVAANRFIESVDHWIAFVLLAMVGGHMIWNAVRQRPDDTVPDKTKSRLALFVTAIGTSIDAMIVGVSLAFLEVNVIVVAAAIGCATFVMSTIGILVGHKVGVGLGRRAEAVGGVLLIGLGSVILYQHLTAV